MGKTDQIGMKREKKEEKILEKFEGKVGQKIKEKTQKSQI